MNTELNALEAQGFPGEAPKTRLALLGTLGHLHTELVRYDLACLRSLVETIEPDLLGVEMEPEAWEGGDLSSAALEVREALLPAARRTETVVVPLGASSPDELAPPEGGGQALIRAHLLRAADDLLTGLQRMAATPQAVNSPTFGHLCGLVCSVEEAAAGTLGRQAWEATNQRILEGLMEVMGRDPGRRLLVAVQCRRVHWLTRRLRYQDMVTLVPYDQL